jgi:hypothetical protein
MHVSREYVPSTHTSAAYFSSAIWCCEAIAAHLPAPPPTTRRAEKYMVRVQYGAIPAVRDDPDC